MSPFDSESLTLVGIFLMGLGLNLTPCVYPMLSVTVSLFEEQHEIFSPRALLKAVIYVLGIATMYSTLGVAAAFTGGIFGAFLQNRFVLLGAALLVGLLALSMFGLYTFQIPAWLLKRAGVRRGAGFVGTYLAGLLVGVFAAPCIGPPIVALMTLIGSKGDPVFGFFVFFVMALGLGFPYLLLATFSGSLKLLPRSGVWLVWMERLFGVVLMTVAVSYLVLAVAPAYVKWVFPAALAAGGLYLGFLERSHVYPSAFDRFRKIAGAAAIVIGILIPLAGPRQGVVWEPYAAEKLSAAAAAGKPVILDFYADWCIPCHELDQFTYTDTEVIRALERFARLKVDLTSPESVESEEVMERFEILGVPTVIFLDAQGRELERARVTGFIPAREMLELIRSPELEAKKTA